VKKSKYSDNLSIGWTNIGFVDSMILFWCFISIFFI